MASAPSGSLIVPTFNRRAALIRLLDSLSYQTVPYAQFEVVVSVDGSTDGTQMALNRYKAPFSLKHRFHENVGRAKSCNIGASVAVGRTLVFLDDDMVPTPTFLEEHFRAQSLGPRRAVVGAAPIDLAGSLSPAGRYVAERFNRHLQKLRMPEFRFQSRDFYSGNFSIDRELFFSLGGFDETFRVYGNEDVDLSIRMRLAGIAIQFSQDAAAVQHNDKTLESVANDSFNKGRTAVMLTAKHPSVLAELRLNWISESPLALRALQWISPTVGSDNLTRHVVRVLSFAERVPSLPRRLYYERAFGFLFWLGALEQIRQDYGTLSKFRRSVGLFSRERGPSHTFDKFGVRASRDRRK